MRPALRRQQQHQGDREDEWEGGGEGGRTHLQDTEFGGAALSSERGSGLEWEQ